MTDISNNFDGGTNGVGMTTGNTGGASGTAFTAVEATLTFSNEWAKSGTLSAKYPATGSGYGRWAFSSRDASCRLYVRETAAQTADVALGNLRLTSSSATSIAYILITPANQLRLRHTASGTNLWTASAAFPTNQDVRVELLADQGTSSTTGQLRIAYYLGDSLTPVQDSGWITGLDLRYTEGPITQFFVAKVGSVTHTGNIYVDSAVVRTGADNTGFIGPDSTAYVSSPADSVGITDSVTRVISKEVTINDSLGIFDTGAPQSIDFGLDFTDSIGLTDEATRSVGMERTLSDSLGATDAATGIIGNTRSLADTLGITDSATVVLGRFQVPGDAIGITDAVTTASGAARSPADSMGLTDAVTAVQAGTRAPADALGLTDVVAPSWGLARGAADTLGITDAVSVVAQRTVAPADGLGISDAAAVSSDRGVSDVLDLTDDVTLAKGVVATASETLGMSDSVSVSLFGGETFIDDLLGLSDDVTSSAANVRTYADTVSGTDSVAVVSGASRTINETLALSDSVSVSYAASGATQVSDTIGLTDEVLVMMTRSVSIAEPLSLADTSSASPGYERVVSDPLTLADVATGDLSVVRAAYDSLGLTDSVVATIGSGAVFDTLALSDAVTTTMSRTLELADELGIQEQVTHVGATPPLYTIEVPTDLYLVSETVTLRLIPD